MQEIRREMIGIELQEKIDLEMQKTKLQRSFDLRKALFPFENKQIVMPDMILTDHPSEDEVSNAIDNPDNLVVALHKPGSLVTSRSGKRYRVDENGTWRKED